MNKKLLIDCLIWGLISLPFGLLGAITHSALIAIGAILFTSFVVVWTIFVVGFFNSQFFNNSK